MHGKDVTGGMRRAARWRRCRWPHRIMSPAEELAFVETVDGFRHFIKCAAAVLSHDDRWLRQELEQAALILLWRWGAWKIEVEGDKRVCGAIVRTMRKARRTEQRLLSDVGLVYRRSS